MLLDLSFFFKSSTRFKSSIRFKASVAFESSIIFLIFQITLGKLAFVTEDAAMEPKLALELIKNGSSLVNIYSQFMIAVSVDLVMLLREMT